MDIYTIDGSKSETGNSFTIRKIEQDNSEYTSTESENDSTDHCTEEEEMKGNESIHLAAQSSGTPVKNYACIDMLSTNEIHKNTPRTKSGRRRVAWHTDDTKKVEKFFTNRRLTNVNLETFLRKYSPETLERFNYKRKIVFLRDKAANVKAKLRRE